jgi:c(7)-type cytochrome triheme protein
MRYSIYAILACTAIIAVALPCAVLAIPSGMVIEYESKAGNVPFEGKIHAVYQCNVCHPNVFKYKKGSDQVLFNHHFEDKYCFSCHNRESAFGPKDNCMRCHKPLAK